MVIYNVIYNNTISRNWHCYYLVFQKVEKNITTKIQAMLWIMKEVLKIIKHTYTNILRKSI